MTTGQIIVLVAPVFLLMMAGEWAWSRRRGSATYRLDDALNSLSLGMLSQITGVLGGLVSLGLYHAAYSHLALVQADAFWMQPLGWLLALVLYDLCYYWLHRMGHRVGVLWAAHAVHHQSQCYNLSTALRQTSTGFLLGWLFYLPMALLGVPILVFAVVALIDLLYQFWVHTEQVKRLGRFDRWFCSPSNHRVHHAVNDRYLDKNYGGILMLWDHLFGTFEPEDPAEPCVYGTRSPLNSWDPLWANAQVYVQLWQAAGRATRWADRLGVWLRPPGWQPAAAAATARATKPFIPTEVPTYQIPLTSAQRGFAWAQFAGMLGLTAGFLWNAGGWERAHQVTGVAGLLVAAWAQGAHLQQRLNAWACLAVQAAVLSTLSSAWGWIDVHHLAKPVAMVMLLIWIATYPMPTSDIGHFSLKKWWLVAAVGLSLAGDVFLMLSDHLFVAGLAAFLLAHLSYLALFSRDAPWWPHRPWALAIAGIGVAYASVLWPHLPGELRLPVAVYVLAIVAMVAQALGRAHHLGTRNARRVAVGAVLFMVSDALLGFNRFVSPLPWSPLWVLGHYGMAQILMVLHVLPPIPGGWPAEPAQAALK